MGAIDDVLRNNERYAEGFDRAGLPAPPALHLAVVACMDARLDVGRMLGLREGDAHVIRNAGGAVSEDALRSLVISQRLLGTREIMLIHHTGCGMQTFDEADLKAQLLRDTGIRPPFAFEAFSDLEEDVRQSMARLRACPFLPHTDAIRGFVYEMETGRLREVEAT